MREVARRFHVSLSTVQRWVTRAGCQRLGRIDWSDRPDGQRPALNRYPSKMEDLVLDVRRKLKETDDLGYYGADAIYREVRRRKKGRVPCIRTIGRILERRGALDGLRRHRRPAPPRGWYLPDVAAGRAELDSFDFIEGLVIKDGPEVQVLNVTSLHGGLVNAWPTDCGNASTAVDALPEHWRAFGLPSYAQFDNDTRFQGPHQHPDVLGRVTRVCLSLGVVPVFVPPQETGFQATIENLNGLWQAKVWARFHHESLAALRLRSAKYVAARRRRDAARIESAPPRRAFPASWKLDLETLPSGRIIYLRRTDHCGVVSLLGHTFEVDPRWQHRLVRSVVDLDAGAISFFSLRRSAPAQQLLLLKVPYRLQKADSRE